MLFIFKPGILLIFQSIIFIIPTRVFNLKPSANKWEGQEAGNLQIRSCSDHNLLRVEFFLYRDGQIFLAEKHFRFFLRRKKACLECDDIFRLAGPQLFSITEIWRDIRNMVLVKSCLTLSYVVQWCSVVVFSHPRKLWNLMYCTCQNKKKFYMLQSYSILCVQEVYMS